jgi:hypothetical protein
MEVTEFDIEMCDNEERPEIQELSMIETEGKIKMQR